MRAIRIALPTALAAAVLGAAAACQRGSTGGGGPTDDFDRRAMLAHLGGQVILPTYRDFRDAADQLVLATASNGAAVGTAGEAASLETARAAWRTVMAIWQEAELFQLGPAGLSSATTGGQGLRDEIYSWPTVNPCRIDQEIVDRQYDDEGFFDGELVNVYGIDAIEYLLFHDGPDNQCPSQVTINQSGAWAALSAQERAQRRADYAAAAAVHLAADAKALVDAWEPTAGDFLGTLSTAGESGSPFETAQQAVDELFAAMFYLDLTTKDVKLAVPAGISPDCDAVTCPDDVESPWSGHSKENITANLRAFRRLLVGGETPEAGIGFDDFLVELGAEALSTAMIEKTDAALTAVASIAGTLESSIAADPTAARDAHAALKAVTDELKSQFVAVLNLRVPDEGAADND